MPRNLVVHWNVIPHYLGSATRIRAWRPGDVAAAGPLLVELLSLLPKLRCVILGGRAAQAAWQAHAPHERPLLAIECPHPSATNLNTRPEARAKIVEAWREALST